MRWLLYTTVGLLAALSSGCESDTWRAARACFSLEDCQGDETCFFGQCVAVDFSLNQVYAEITPPNDSPWIAQQVPYPLALSGFQEVGVRDSVILSGGVHSSDTGDAASLLGTLVVRPVQSFIPGRILTQRGNVSELGFEMPVLADQQMALTFEPAADNLPPKDFWVDSRGADRDGLERTLSYPSAAELTATTFSGRVLRDNLEQSFVQGVTVVGAGVSPQHPGTLFRSSRAVTGEQGHFSVTFLPEVAEIEIDVGPTPGVNKFVPEVEFGPFDRANTDIGDLILGVTKEESITVAVVDELGDPVIDADVVFEGVVGDNEGTFSTSTTSNDQGDAPATLLPGKYRVTVAPSRSQPYALTWKSATIPNGSYLEITVHEKVPLAGCVGEHATHAVVPDASISLTRLDSPVPRIFRTTTDENGCYEVFVDPGEKDADGTLVPAQYVLTIQPENSSGLPFYRERIEMGAETAARHDVELYEAELVYGRVEDPSGVPLANVILAFYSLELTQPDAQSDEPVLVGVVSTYDGLRAGEFVLPIPVPSN